MMIAAAPLEAGGAPPPPAARSAAWLVGMAVASLVGMLFAVSMHLELMSSTALLMSGDAFAQLALLRDAWFALAVALPGAIALGQLLVPASRSVVVERLERLALAGFAIAGAALLVASLAAGWTSLLAVAIAGTLATAGAIAQSAAFVARLSAARPRGSEASPFARAFAPASAAALVALPVSLGMFAALFVERLAHVALWRDAGADPVAFAHALSLALRPVVYLAVVPCLGAIGELLALRARTVTIAATAMLLLGGVAWAARLFGGDDAGAVAVTSFFSLALLVPAAIVVVEWLAAIRATRERDGAFWLAIAAMVLFVELALSAPPLAMADLAPSLGGNAFATAHHELLLAMLGFAVAATLHRAWPRLAAAPSQMLARIGGIVAFAGVHVAAAAQVTAGLRGMPATIDYPAALRPWAILSGAGWLLVAAGAAILGVNLLGTLRRQASSA
jgi:hypothetical protein